MSNIRSLLQHRKIAQTVDQPDSAPRQQAAPTLPSVLSTLMAMRMFYQYAHWVASGPLAYQKHLLYNQLYNEVNAAIDPLAEKIVGLFGDMAIPVQQLSAEAAQLLSNPGIQKGALDDMAMSMEWGLQSTIQGVFSSMEADGSLTLGLDDLLMRLFSGSEDRVYLLKRGING